MLNIINKATIVKFRAIATASVFILSVASFVMIPIQKAVAFTPNYNPSNLIDNGTLVNNQTMSADQIQIFLTNTGSGLTNYSDVEACDATIAPYYTHCGQNISAAQIIYDASQAYDINPRAILATLEKEQSLITDPTPTSSQIDCAMGYNSCSGYVGFFTQVDNGTWALAYNYQGALGTANWLSWAPANNYPCASAKSSFYSSGLYSGNTVTFTDSGGTAETITLANAATASLYCYTPYVGPYSVTGYSGSYNFVYYYQLWFGSTQTSVPYAWNYVSQSAYADAAHTQPFSNIPTVAPGQNIYLQIQARNVGYMTWEQSNLHLGTDNPQDRISPFANSNWLNAARPASLSTTSVGPGSVGVFNFTDQAPSQPGTYYEYYNLVDDGVTWLNDPGCYFEINVVNPDQPVNNQNTGLSSGQSMSVGHYLLSPDTQSTLNLLPNGDLVEYENYKQVWSNGVFNSNAASLVMQADGNLEELDTSGNVLWSSGTSGNNGATLVLQTDGNLVIYNSSGTPLWATYTVNIPNHLDQVVETLPIGYLYPGQSLQNAAQTYKLVLQYDGNLVEYKSSGVPIWSTNTSGQSVAYLAMQSDGNLVLYGTNGQALWNSQTEGSNSTELDLQPNGVLSLDPASNAVLWPNNRLYPGQSIKTTDRSHKVVLQYDGNLVLYNAQGVATWASNTAGLPSAYAVMQSDGNLVIYDANNKPLWSSNTSGNGPSYLSMQTDGNLVIYKTGGGGATWASNTVGK